MWKRKNNQEEQKRRERKGGQEGYEADKSQEPGQDLEYDQEPEHTQNPEHGQNQDQEQNQDQGKKGKMQGIKKVFRRIKQIFILTVTIIAAFAIWDVFFRGRAVEEEKVTIVTAAQLEKVLQISELSTYKVTYNGVAAVSDDKDKLLYYVAYEADVSIGLDMELVRVQVEDNDEEHKRIVVTLPPIGIDNVDVAPGSLDYIFEKKSANTDDVSATAIPACRMDAQEECQSNEMLFELARENAVNTIEALMKPLLEQYEEYSLVIVCEGGE